MSGNREIADIEQLIAQFEQSDLTELHARHAGLEIYLSKDHGAPGLDGVRTSVRSEAVPAVSVPAPPAAGGAASPPAETAATWPEGAQLVRAPYLGSFYRAPKPGAAAFVEIGQHVTPDTEMCLVEVMKLFTSLRAGCGGKVHAILAEDGQMVEADQPLFVVLPD